ncbi:MAG: DUF4124 domain-containing protein [Gammaproteobacteria bacterium]|nr:DUF4124 domain-containing protein [Gammaproteobacteria bacterium]
MSNVNHRYGKWRTAATLCVLAGALFLLVGEANATRIYKSIDAAGHVTYSATPPADAVQTETMQVSGEYDIDSSSAHDAIMEDIRKTAAQLEQDRKQREQARDDARADEAEPPAASPPQPTVIQYYPVYPPRNFYPHRPHPPRHPRGQRRDLSPEQQSGLDQK